MGNSASARAVRVAPVAAALPQRGRGLSAGRCHGRVGPAAHAWTAANPSRLPRARTPLVRRVVQVSHVLKKKRSNAALGFSVESRPSLDGGGGYTHVVSHCKEGRLGWVSGLRDGTAITSVNDAPCDGLGHHQVVGLLLECSRKGALAVGSTATATATATTNGDSSAPPERSLWGSKIVA